MELAQLPTLPDCARCLIGGEWVEPLSGATYVNESPIDHRNLGKTAIADASDVDRAVKAARSALEGPWTKISPSDRARLLMRVAEMLRFRSDDLAVLESLDTGKPLAEAQRGDIPLSAEYFEYFAGWATKVTGETIPVPARFFDYTCREPVGVVGAIIPWNFPLQMAATKVAPALAMGNAIILKPAEQTPLTAMALGAIAQEVGLPPGVLNIVPGFGDTGEAIVDHPDVDKISFTGSTTVGKRIMKHAAESLKRVSLELGGKSPNIVFDDAEIGRAIRGVTTGIYYNQGQMCTAGSRVLVQRRIYDEFLEGLRKEVAAIKVGDPLAKETRMGSLVSKDQLERVTGYAKLANEEGATLVHRGELPSSPVGYFVPPMIFADVQPEMRIAREEIFGPIVSIISFDEEEQAISIANSSRYGLAAGIWTQNLSRAHRVARRLKAGSVWVNTYNAIWAEAPFGGYKESGLGREGGRHGAELFTEVKNVCIFV